MKIFTHSGNTDPYPFPHKHLYLTLTSKKPLKIAISFTFPTEEVNKIGYKVKKKKVGVQAFDLSKYENTKFPEKTISRKIIHQNYSNAITWNEVRQNNLSSKHSQDHKKHLQALQKRQNMAEKRRFE